MLEGARAAGRWPKVLESRVFRRPRARVAN
jgi:hypothetical protein